MLPDWPMAKEELIRAFMRQMRARLRERSLAGIATVSPVFEGHGTGMSRADGFYEERDFDSASAEMKIPVDAIKTEAIPDIFARMDPIIESLAKTQSETMQRVMEAGVKSVGNQIDGGGQPISAELILTALDRVLMDFDENGQPKWPTIIVHPNQESRVAGELARLQSEPELIRRFQEIMGKKLAEFRARETDRVLVG